jgi:YidC/Oxa1 family membrane protein insertase
LDTSRLLIAIVLSLGLVFAYQELVLKKMYPPPDKNAAQPTAGQIAGTPIPSLTGATNAPSTVASNPADSTTANPTLATASNVPEKLVEVDSDLFRAVFTNHGARLKSFQLKEYKESATPNSPSYEMVHPSSTGRLPLGIVVDNGGTAPADDHDLDYVTTAPPKTEVHDGQKVTVTFEARTSDGMKIEKTFTFNGDKYVFDMEAKVNSPKQPASIGLAMTEPLTERGEGYYDIPALQAYVQDKVLNENEKSLRKGIPPVTGKISFAGFGDRYFLTAYMPESPAVGMLSMEFIGSEASARLLFPNTTTVETQVYMGPKKLESLEAVSPALTKSINFGWAGVLALAFLRILKLFHNFVPNWGWDIILMTIALRILMLPMSIRGQRSMIRMQRLQPQMERLRAQFKDDSERLNKEMVDLYKRNHVNPVGGCAPMIIQLPVFIGLYEALLAAVDLRHAPFIWWMKDLSAPDCFPIAAMPKLPFMHCQGIPVLVLLMGLSAYAQQAMTPTQPDPNQQRMMMLSPIIFTIFLVNFPAGLSLYYFASNVLGAIQQFVLNREFKQATPPS